MTPNRIVRLGYLVALAIVAGKAAANPVQVVDIIPPSMNSESQNNPEPFIAVDPANNQIIAVSAFITTPAGSMNGPLMVSTDGGAHWSPNNILPSAAGFLNTGDITIHFNSAGTMFYAGILQATGSYELNVLTTSDMTLTTPMTVVSAATETPVDQPYTTAQTVHGWVDAGKDRVWIGNRQMALDPAGPSIDTSLDAAIGSPTFVQHQLDPAPGYWDAYQTRAVSAPDGRVYGAYYRRLTTFSGGFNADVVVVRDDNWGNDASPFTDLKDSMTMIAGQRAAINTPVSDSGGSSSSLGNEWWTGDLFLTVDPNNSSTVYFSYSDANPSNNTLHLVRSIDAGQTWTPLLATTPGHNAAIAVNSQGAIAYLYQTLTGAVGSHHWQTHLRRSYDNGMTFDDVTLSDFPGEGPTAPPGGRIVGDYLDMVAVGKNFYGVFSADNDLVNATFPQGVSFQRNKTPDGAMNPHFLQTDNITIVPPSVDPFFFKTTELAANEDFYVRDWTDSSSSHDQGQEPSTHGDFFSTSDVWNERTNDPLPFDANDRPQVHDPQPMAMGPDYAFVRVSREATGVAQDVSLQFYYSDGGVGVNFLDAGSATSVHFNAGDSVKAPAAGDGVTWQLPSGASNHVCLAVEISTPDDPIIQPSLFMRAPGWPGTDLAVMGDNNKAQRNMQVFGFGGMAAGNAGMSMYAIVHNAATFTRNMQIAVTTGSRRLDDAAQGVTLGTVTGDDRKAQSVRPGNVLTLPGMQPGENRWVEFRFNASAAPQTLQILELANNRVINGYAFQAEPMALSQAIRESIFQHAAVFSRLDELGIEGARDQAKAAIELSRARTIDPRSYLGFLQKQSGAMEAVLSRLLQAARMGDPVSAGSAFEALRRSSDNPGMAQAMHLTLLNKIDALATMRQKQDGDIADIGQNVRWQRDLFSVLGRTDGAMEVVKRSDEFLQALSHRRIRIEAFAALVSSLSTAYKSAAAHFGGGLPSLAEAMLHANSLAALQKAHRAYLISLGEAAKHR